MRSGTSPCSRSRHAASRPPLPVSPGGKRCSGRAEQPHSGYHRPRTRNGRERSSAFAAIWAVLPGPGPGERLQRPRGRPSETGSTEPCAANVVRRVVIRTIPAHRSGRHELITRPTTASHQLMETTITFESLRAPSASRSPCFVHEMDVMMGLSPVIAHEQHHSGLLETMGDTLGRAQSRLGHRHGHARQLDTSMATTGPGGRCRRYCSYLFARSSSARRRSSPVSMTRPVPSRRTHHRAAQSSS